MEVHSDLTLEELSYYRGLIEVLRSGETLGRLIPKSSESAAIHASDISGSEIRVENESRRLILAAEESLLAACHFAGEGSHRFPWAVYSLVRTSLENAATVHWILSGTSPEQRHGRLCLLRAETIKKRISLGNGGSDSEQVALRRLAEHLGVPAKTNCTITERMRAFDRATRQEGIYYSTGAWGAFSAIVHGAEWAAQALSSSQVVDGVSNTTQNAELADKAAGLAIWALRQAHMIFGSLTDVDLSNRIPEPNPVHQEGNAS